MKADHLVEPELEFGGGERHVDIRFGLMSFGPLDRNTPTAPHEIRVGIVGTPNSVEGVAGWLTKCRSAVPAKQSRLPNLFPGFPGFAQDGSFDAELALDQAFRARISPRELELLATQAARSEAVDEAAELFLSDCQDLIDKVQPQVRSEEH